MFKSSKPKLTNHPSSRMPSIVHIPKPLLKNRITVCHSDAKKRLKTFQHNENDGYVMATQRNNKIATLSHHQNISCNQQDWNPISQRIKCDTIYNLQTFSKKQLSQVMRPKGDVSQCPPLSASEIRESAITNISLPVHKAYEKQKKQKRQSSQLKNKEKPKIPEKAMRGICEDRSNLMVENEILKIENEKLKQLSHKRKNQISILLQQIMDLKSQINNFLDYESEEQQEDNQSLSLTNIEKSLTLISHKREDSQKKREVKKLIANQIYSKLKNVLVQQTFRLQQYTNQISY